MKYANKGLYPVAQTLRELLAYNDAAFIDCAYKTLLGRAVEPAGLQWYVGLLRAGKSKVRLLAAISLSREGRIAGALSLPGLKWAIVSYGLASNPLTGWWWRPVMQAEGDTPLERHLRAIEICMLRIIDERERESSELDSAAESVTGLLKALAERNPA